MPNLIEKPTRITAAGTKPKLIDEYVGRVNTGETAVKLVAFLEGEGYQPFFRTYPMDNQISLAELRDLGPWVRNVLPAHLDKGQVGREG